MTDVILVITTVSSVEEAEAVATVLVNERLAACVSVSAPMLSIYRWQGTVERSEERQLLIKSVRARLAALEARLTALHSYEVPEILVVPIETGEDRYLRWVEAETRHAP